jgi:HPt (histidine-containing phosphotransfer) domain-containing protein
MDSDKFSPFDQAAFLENFKGIESVALEIIAKFLDNLPTLIVDIEAAIAAKNPKQLEIAAHTLSGVVSNFYAKKSQDLAKELEQIGRDQFGQDPTNALVELKLELGKLITALQDFTNGQKIR